MKLKYLAKCFESHGRCGAATPQRLPLSSSPAGSYSGQDSRSIDLRYGMSQCRCHTDSGSWTDIERFLLHGTVCSRDSRIYVLVGRDLPVAADEPATIIHILS